MRFSVLIFGACALAFAVMLNTANAEGEGPPKTEAVVQAVAVAESGGAVKQFDNFPRPPSDRPSGDRPSGDRPPSDRPSGGDCMFRGQDCKRNDDCCSGICDGRGRDRKCAPPSGPPSRPPPRPRCKSRGDDCVRDDECCNRGDVCNGFFRRNTCNEPRPKCKSSGDRCERDSECCNRQEICTGPFRNTCKEPKPKCKFAGDDCKEDDDCCSKQCNRSGRSRKCERKND